MGGGEPFEKGSPPPGPHPSKTFRGRMDLHADIAAIDMVGGAVCCVELLALAVSIVGTERALRKAFDKNGRPRVA